MYSLKLTNQYKKRIIPIIQDLYDSWSQDSTGYSEMYGFDGVYYEIVDSITDFMLNEGINCETIEDDFDNIYTLVKMEDGVFLIGVNPNKFQYKTNGIVSKIDNVVFSEGDIYVKNIDSNISAYDKYVSGELQIDTNYILKESINNSNGSFIPDEISVNVENTNSELVNKLINGLSLVIRKRSIKNLRILSIDGIFNKLDISILSYSNLKIKMSNGDDIQMTFSIDENKIPNIKILINDTLIYDLDHISYTLDVSIDKVITNYTKYLQSRNWKIKE